MSVVLLFMTLFRSYKEEQTHQQALKEIGWITSMDLVIKTEITGLVCFNIRIHCF